MHATRMGTIGVLVGSAMAIAIAAPVQAAPAAEGTASVTAAAQSYTYKPYMKATKVNGKWGARAYAKYKTLKSPAMKKVCLQVWAAAVHSDFLVTTACFKVYPYENATVSTSRFKCTVHPLYAKILAYDSKNKEMKSLRKNSVNYQVAC
ncbi:hypothetical protein [Actinomadura geliboluensis]|uniref:hypothetical protein n=1 Tax=Actinomadura geliboluensis TaxID=882440 RepID=UPI0036980245